jgi:hypothetical protein
MSLSRPYHVNRFLNFLHRSPFFLVPSNYPKSSSASLKASSCFFLNFSTIKVIIKQSLTYLLFKFSVLLFLTNQVVMVMIFL